MPTVELSHGTLNYREEGSGPPLLFVHGLLVDGQVWERVVPLLARRCRCVAPDLPLGSHRIPMSPDADLSPPGLASLIVELIGKLDLPDVTLIANDTGGALSQLVAAHHPDAVGRLVLTNCDAFEHFPPATFKPLLRGLGVPAVVAAVAWLARSRRIRQASMGSIGLTVEPIPGRLVEAWVAPLRDPAIRRDLARVTRAISSDYTLAAADKLRGFDRPTLLAWAMRDRFFPFADCERLAAVLPDARVERIENAKAFVQLDAPGQLTELIAEFVSATDGART
jgi:pimeloyl-ACP methyl ester carboxylesterase